MIEGKNVQVMRDIEYERGFEDGASGRLGDNKNVSNRYIAGFRDGYKKRSHAAAQEVHVDASE